MTSPEVADAGARVLILPLGSCEQHGPHLPLDTDTRIAVALAHGIAAARTDAVVAPAVAFGSSGEHEGFAGTLSVGTEALRLLLVELVRSNRDMDHVADTVEDFSPSVKFDIPAGVCYTPDGCMYVVERNRVMMFPAVEYFTEGSDTVAFAVVKQGDLIPAEEESYNHTARACTIGPDNRLYITMGQPFNVTPAEKVDMYRKVGIGAILSFNRDGGDRQVIATGVRNSSGLAFNPKDGSLWFTDNQVDGMGDETPPGELNKIPSVNGKLVQGGWYGHPYYGGGDVRTDDYKGKPIPKDMADKYVKPQVEMIAHAADLGMMFYTGDMFPAKYKNAIFSAQHGSWNAVKPRGARVMVTYLDDKGNAAKTEAFAEGWMTAAGYYLGRPVDVQQYVDGSILVSDDKAGAVYRISYQK